LTSLALLPNLVEGYCDPRYTEWVFGARSASGPGSRVVGGRYRNAGCILSAWKEFLGGQPELWDGWRTVEQVAEDELLNRFDDPKPDYGNEMEPGKSWHGDDKCRTRRSRRPTQRPWRDQSMIDGSPLRRPGLGELDADGDPFTGPGGGGVVGESPDGIPDDPDARDYADDKDAVGEILWRASQQSERLTDGDDIGCVGRLDGVHGESAKFNDTSPHLLERCELCCRPVPLKWGTRSVCQFAEQPFTFEERCASVFCRCNGCLTGPVRGKRRPRLCGKRCRRRMDDALDRARRRVKGTKSRVFDPEADRIADYRSAMKLRAWQRKDDGTRYQFDWTGVWAFPTTRPVAESVSYGQVGPHVWEIAPTAT
jgi:hypothetical protein